MDISTRSRHFALVRAGAWTISLPYSGFRLSDEQKTVLGPLQRVEGRLFPVIDSVRATKRMQVLRLSFNPDSVLWAFISSPR